MQVLREALESFHTLFEAFDAMREEVKRLTTDNEMCVRLMASDGL